MRIGVYGNINNYPFMLVRALRALGQDVHVWIDSDDRLHRPEHRYGDIGVPYPAWITDVAPREPFFPVVPSSARDATVRALWPLVRRPAFIVATGTDLEVYCDPCTPRVIAAGAERFPRALRRAVRLGVYATLVRRQRAGYRGALAVSYHVPGISAHADALLDGLGLTGPRRDAYQLVALDAIAPAAPPARAVPRLFAVARHTWVKPFRPGMSTLDDKGSDVMIRGLARWVTERGRPLDIRFVEKGADVAASRALVESLGLAPMVTWLPELTQAQVLDEYRAADIVLDQFGASMMSMGALDAMAVGRPVIANGRPDVITPFRGEPSPHAQAASVEAIVAQLDRLAPDPAAREAMGRASRAYIERHHDPMVAARAVLARFRAATGR